MESFFDGLHCKINKRMSDREPERKEAFLNDELYKEKAILFSKSCELSI
jgi:hypothetical protein